ncbi:hypothetical protein [Actinacidiphila glaucinigra]|uniref:hypothetical protein n=1 Tax=Actinacidiphila glaucinigra TaxID=235986 RepID=UPI00371EE75F
MEVPQPGVAGLVVGGQFSGTLESSPMRQPREASSSTRATIEGSTPLQLSTSAAMSASVRRPSKRVPRAAATAFQ